jgi:hypothetical protein
LSSRQTSAEPTKSNTIDPPRRAGSRGVLSLSLSSSIQSILLRHHQALLADLACADLADDRLPGARLVTPRPRGVPPM